MDRSSEYYARFLAGDESGLVELIRINRDPLILFLNGYVHDMTAAEQLAEDVFVRLAMKKPRDKGGACFRTWLFTIGKNLALDKLRKDRRERTVPFDSAADRKSDEAEEALEEAVFKSERRKAVFRAMEKLTESQRSVLFLTYFEGLSLREAGRVLGKSAHAAESLASRARAALKKELEKEGVNDENI